MKPEAVSGPAIRLVIKPLPGPSGYAFNLLKDDATHAFLSGILRARLPCSPRYLAPTLCAAREVPACETRFQPQNPTDRSKQLTKEPRGDQKDGFPLFSLRKMQPLQSKCCLPQLTALAVLGDTKTDPTDACPTPVILSPADEVWLCLGTCPRQGSRAASLLVHANHRALIAPASVKALPFKIPDRGNFSGLSQFQLSFVTC